VINLLVQHQLDMSDSEVWRVHQRETIIKRLIPHAKMIQPRLIHSLHSLQMDCSPVLKGKSISLLSDGTGRGGKTFYLVAVSRAHTLSFISLFDLLWREQ
jgi:hypothetical protein